MDAVLLAVTILFFLASVLYVFACDRLGGGKWRSTTSGERPASDWW